MRKLYMCIVRSMLAVHSACVYVCGVRARTLQNIAYACFKHQIIIINLIENHIFKVIHRTVIRYMLYFFDLF